MFNFYFKVVKTGLITFCGSEVNVEFDIKGYNGKSVLGDLMMGNILKEVK